ncbi:hypothetical protein [Oceanicola sp. S124]|uniref:hypothetical protein n=1 Tax=Oceanicola sp. S124 TaxID=1042378 RepID=UPI00110FAF83|nr:hypothetical protein [Oceanicola sp. S124]
MSEENVPIGKLYSRVYLQPTETVRDGARMRMRVLRAIEQHIPSHRRNNDFGAAVEGELGIEIVRSSAYVSPYIPWERLVRQELSVSDLLNVLTMLWRAVGDDRRRTIFRNNITRIFAEEAIGFSVDEEMGFHPAFDEEFDRSRSSIVRMLSGERFRHESDFIALSETALLAKPLDGRTAIRAVYDAAENLFKRITGKQNITNGHVRKALAPVALQGIPQDGKSNVAVNKMLDSFEDWAAACHVYRHAPGVAETMQPTEAITILMVSQGYGFVRWLAELSVVQSE